MENASKALSIAASVLIGVMLVALLYYAYYRITTIPQQKEQLKRQEQSAEFNKVYESYNQQYLSGTKFITLLNMVVDNNLSVNENEKKGNEISITLDGRTDFQQIYERDIQTYRTTLKADSYSCEDISYNSENGRINKMEFKTNKK